MLQFFAPQIFTGTSKKFFTQGRPNLQKLAEGQEEKKVLPLFGKCVLNVPITISKAAIQNYRDYPAQPVQSNHPFGNSASEQVA